MFYTAKYAAKALGQLHFGVHLRGLRSFLPCRTAIRRRPARRGYVREFAEIVLSPRSWKVAPLNGYERREW